MPVTYSLDAQARLVPTSCIGNVNLAEVLAHLREFEKDPDSAGQIDVFLDLSETTSLPLGFQIAAVAEQLRKIHETVRFNACAVVAQREALYGMMRMFSVMAEPYFRAIRVFRGYAEAETWLASERSPVGVSAGIRPAGEPPGGSMAGDSRNQLESGAGKAE
jgi:hypothetical protein